MLHGSDIAKPLNLSGQSLQVNLRDRLNLVRLMQIKILIKALLQDSEFKVSQLSKFSIMDQRVMLKLTHTTVKDKPKTSLTLVTI
jgi:hypothetical protein